MFEKKDEVSFGMSCTGSGYSWYNDISGFVSEETSFKNWLNHNILKNHASLNFVWSLIDRFTRRQEWRGGVFGARMWLYSSTKAGMMWSTLRCVV